MRIGVTNEVGIRGHPCNQAKWRLDMNKLTFNLRMSLVKPLLWQNEDRRNAQYSADKMHQ